jgi:hypothetical protein
LNYTYCDSTEVERGETWFKIAKEDDYNTMTDLITDEVRLESMALDLFIDNKKDIVDEKQSIREDAPDGLQVIEHFA